MRKKICEPTLFDDIKIDKVEKQISAAENAHDSLIKLLDKLQSKMQDSVDNDEADLKESLKLGAEIAKTIPAMIDAAGKLKAESSKNDRSEQIADIIRKDKIAFKLSVQLLERISLSIKQKI